MAKVKAKKKKKRPTATPKMCDPGICDNCLYICEGDFLCDKYQEIVVGDWQPTENYLMCRGDRHA